MTDTAPHGASLADLWAFVEAAACSSRASDDGDSSSAEEQLTALRQVAQALLARRPPTASAAPPRPPQLDDAEASDDTVHTDLLYEQANERVARRMLERTASTTSSTHDGSMDDKSDTLSDCTALSETSSVFGRQNTWVDLALLYSLPFVASADGVTGSATAATRLKPVPPINVALEQSQLHKLFAESHRAIHTTRAVATVDSLRKVLDRGVTVLHFSGHGGRIAGKTNCLLFEDTQRTGLAHFIDAPTLRSILHGGVAPPPATTAAFDSTETSGAPGFLTRTESFDESSLPPSSLALQGSISSSSRSMSSISSSMSSSSSSSNRIGLGGTLKLVFVSSCHSRDVGDVFIQAGVHHVVCVGNGDKVLDEASSMFAYAFYHAVLTGGKTIHQAFDVARARVRADMQLPQNEGDKFILLESSQVHADSCPLYSNSNSTDDDDDERPRAIDVHATLNACTCQAASSHFVFTDISSGKWIDVSPTNRFAKTLPAIPESFVGREQELHMLAGLVNTQRVVTMRGPPGIGKSTLSIKLAHFLAERNTFPDGVAFVRLRGVQSVEGMETALKTALFPDGGRDKEMPLHHVLGEMKVLLIMDNMEDPINANPAPIREFLVHLLQNTPSLAFLMTARQAMGGGMAGFDEKVVSLNRLSHFHAADLFLRKSPRALLLSEIGEINPQLSSKLRTASVVEALTSHPLMAFLDGHPQAISLCAPLLQDRSLSELTRAVLSRGVSELQVVGLGANDRSAMNTLVTSLDVSLEQVRHHHGQDAIRFFALLGLLPAGAMPADFKSLWGPKWETLVETLMRFSLIQRNRIPGFVLTSTSSRGLPKQGVSSSSSSSSRRQASSSRSSSSSSRPGACYDQALLLALKAYGDFISGKSVSSSSSASSSSTAKGDAFDIDTRHGPSSSLTTSSQSERSSLNTFTRSGRASRVVDHVEKMDSHADIMAVCVSYSTFPFITSYARSLLGLYDDDGTKNQLLESICMADRDVFLYNCARHFWKVSFWIFQHICTLAARSTASYMILDLHESNLWMLLDLHIRMMEEWRSSETSTATNSDGLAGGGDHGVSSASETQASLRERTSSFVVDVACFFAHSLFLSGRHRGAWHAANKTLHIAKFHKDTMSEANTRKLMGILLTTETKFDEAKAQFGMALILYKSVGDKMGQAASLSAIGMIHSRKGNLRGAHNCFTKALTLYEWFKHSLGQLNCHQRLANLEKKLRDGDGLRGKNGQSMGHSHHYAATRRLQGDLNRKRNGEYIVRWVGHETSLLLELPTATQEKIHEAHAAAAGVLSVASASHKLSPIPIDDHAVDGASAAGKPPTPGVSNTPKKCRLGQIIDHHEQAAVSSVPDLQLSFGGGGAATGTSASVPSVATSDALVERLKASSFARRKEYDAAIRRTLSSSSGGDTTGADLAPFA